MSVRPALICALAAVYITYQCLAPAYAADAARSIQNGEFIYVNAERTSFLAIRGAHLEVGSIEPKRAIGEQLVPQVDTATGGRIYDCSNKDYVCIRALRSVFAVPRKRLVWPMTYVVAGTKFSITHCLRGADSVCQVALVRAECPSIKDAESCELVVNSNGRSSQVGPFAYFIFNEDYGITSLGILDEDVQSESEMAAAARRYVLQGEVGILKP